MAMAGNIHGPLLRSSLYPLLCILGLILSAHPGPASAQPGFVSVDCGADTGFTSLDTGIVYLADTNISTGSTAQVTNNKQDFTTLRYFPADSSPVKNCYELSVDANTQYLVRAFFYHGSYVPAPSPSGNITFQLALDSSLWAEVWIRTDRNFYYAYEAIILTKQTKLSVCLIRTVDGSAGVPFINTLELRPLPKEMYLGRFPVPSNFLLNGLRRFNYGEASRDIRYPDDEYDRFWDPIDLSSTDPLISTLTVPANQTFTVVPVDGFAYDVPPNIVMQTAVTHPTLLNLTFSFNYTLYQRFYVTVLMSELQQDNISNIVDISGICYNTLLSLDFTSPPFYTVQLTYPLCKPGSGTVNVLLAKNSTSVLGPFVNGVEIYSVGDVAVGTDDTQATALAAVKANLSRGVWSGDPCFPVPWVGLNCTGGLVTSIDLSNQNLTGDIPDFSGLSSLASLDLSNNAFSGPLPGWVAGLTSLESLDVSNNQLAGTFPSSYINRIPGFRYTNNLQLTCVPTDGVDCPAAAPGQPVAPSPPRSLPSPAESEKKSSVGPIIGGVVGGILLLVVLIGGVLLYCCCFKKDSKVRNPAGESPFLNPSGVGTSVSPLHMPASRGKAQPFTLQSIKEATNNLARQIGEGGFGPVYYGILKPEREVAVKVMSGKSQQGLSEFINEIDLLSTVHYKKLVSLVGYCQDEPDLILLYEYMSGGDLRQRLYGSQSAVHSPINWRQRLHIALDAAKGLDYLHHGCNPSIIHRDVKSSNILLTEKLEAKVADFGLSRITGSEQAHVTTMVKGTLGYLDPEYNSTGKLTDKSDVYSFGIVLLELVMGHAPITKDSSGHTKFIVERVKAGVKTNTLTSIADPQLRGDYKAESLWKVAEVGLSCVALTGASRPDMSKVVTELSQALELEFGGQTDGKWEESGSELYTSASNDRPYPAHYSHDTSNVSSNLSGQGPELPAEEPSQIFHQYGPRAY